MKKLFYYAVLMLTVVVILPLLIVKGCSTEYEPAPSAEKTPQFDVKITLYDAGTNKTQTVDIEEYIKGVVAAEMPAEFELEALKAQAAAARSYTYGRLVGTYSSKPGVHDGTDVCTDPAHCQAWISKEKAMKKWGILFGKRNWNRIERAVIETKGVIVEYDGKIANTLFHSNSGGKTEDSEYVWEGVSVPYLRSVTSIGEEGTKEFKNTVTIKNSEFVEKFLDQYPDTKLDTGKLPGSIKIIDYTPGGRVSSMKVGDKLLKGTDLRSILGLKSANFKIEKADSNSLRITTLGYGHGVGMSQWGANYLAKRGGTYDEILKYYYTGVTLTSIERYCGR